MKNDLVSRQAAIEAIEKHIRTAEEPYQLTDADKVMNHAFEIAASCVYNLSATEADVPDINDGDMISRQAVVKFFNDWISCLDENCHHQSVADMTIIKNDFKNLPSAQSESKKGKWIEAYDPFNRISGRCSICGWEAHLYEDDVVGMNYCPNCGARLEDVVNEL